MFGTSPCDQKTYETLIPQLLTAPGKKFLSIEPLLGQVDLMAISKKDISWIIVGGESGNKARPINPDWVRWLRYQCELREIPFFFKQWGEYNVDGEKVGKKAAGRDLDGGTHSEFPWHSFSIDKTITL